MGSDNTLLNVQQTKKETFAEEDRLDIFKKKTESFLYIQINDSSC